VPIIKKDLMLLFPKVGSSLIKIIKFVPVFAIDFEVHVELICR
jgi:hypothetical protein